MKIAIFSDLHLGYPRFEKDSYVQAQRAVDSASQKADVIFCAGDIFDTKVPKLETLKKAVDIFNRASVPVYAIFGNHERRARDMVNPVQLLAAGTKMKLLHGESALIEKNGEKVQLLGMGSVPEEYATEALNQTMGKFRKEDAFRVLMIHQSIKELMAGSDDELSLEHLEGLPFDLIINGHIHERISRLGGRFLIPGSTVITQLKKEEMEPKGYYIYDTSERKSEFVPIECRKFFYEKLEFDGAGELEVREAAMKRIGEIRGREPDAIIAIKLEGKLKEGLSGSDVRLGDYPDVYIDNKLNMQDLGAKLERIRNIRQENLSVREIALKELRAKTSGKVSFDSAEFFERLLLGSDEALEYLEKEFKKDNK
jgi:DNA repair exonuclease SbcCD nuclease subunit